MKSKILITQPALVELVMRLGRDHSATAVCPVGTAHLIESRTYLVREVNWIPHVVHSGDDLLVVRAGETVDVIPQIVAHEAGIFPPRGEGAVLCLAFEGDRIAVGGAGICGKQAIPLERLTCIGPGLPEVHLGPAATEVQFRRPIEDGRWSRTIGALGERAWRKLTQINCTIVGAGRNGSLAATSLARLGVNHIALIDPDRLEPHSLAEGDFGATVVSHAKVEAAKDFVLSIPHSEGLRVVGFAESVYALPALGAIKAADVVICCVDNAEARYATALLAKVYLKPLLDIGTGILNGPDRPMGADIRLVLPDRCLLCFGGIAGLAGRREAPPADWRTQRAGSLRSLNQIAVGFATRMLEDFVAGRLGSAWKQLNFSPDGSSDLRSRNPAPSHCELCASIGLEASVPDLGGSSQPHASKITK